MKSDHHNYKVYSPEDTRIFSKGIVAKNSHACAYAYLSYITAYLKSNFPDEFICSLLNVETERAHHDKVIEFEHDFARNMGIAFSPRSMNTCKARYTIVKKKDPSVGIPKTEIRPSLMVKSVGRAAADEIEAHQPYANISELAAKTQPVVDAEVVGALIDSGFFRGDKGRNAKERIVREFVQIRKDLKLAAQKGVEVVDILASL